MTCSCSTRARPALRPATLSPQTARQVNGGRAALDETAGASGSPVGDSYEYVYNNAGTLLRKDSHAVTVEEYEIGRGIERRGRLVSVLLGNHETGVLQPIDQLARICNETGVPLHTDAIQVAGKLPICFRQLGVSALSVSPRPAGARQKAPVQDRRPLSATGALCDTSAIVA